MVIVNNIIICFKIILNLSKFNFIVKIKLNSLCYYILNLYFYKKIYKIIYNYNN